MQRSAIVLCGLCVTAPLDAQTTVPAPDTTLTIGARHSIHSTILGEDRPYLVYSPLAAPNTRWPVIVVLDGDAHFLHLTGVTSFLAGNGRMPPAYLVAVPNTRDRTHDLTPRTADTTFGSAGGADAMLSFLVDELLPEIDRRYATIPYRVLIGHSLGGLFAFYGWLSHPDAFQAYVAVSPSLWWDNQGLTDSLAARLARHDPPHGWFYATMGELEPEDVMVVPFRRLQQVLHDGAADSPEWRAVILAQQDHGTTPHRSAYDGLEAIFRSWWVPPDSLVALGVAGLDRRFESMLTYYRFPNRFTPEAALNALGYRLLGEGTPARQAEALDVLRTNASRFPRSANVYDSLGDAYRAMGQKANAISCYAAAVSTGALFPYEGTVVAAADIVPISYGKMREVARELGRTPWEPSTIPKRVVDDCTAGTAK